MQLIIGAELHPIDGPPLVVWASNRRSYADLCRLITLGRRRREKGACQLTWSDIAAHGERLLAGLLLRHPTLDEDDYRKTSLAPDSNPSQPAPVQTAFPTLNFDPNADSGWTAWLGAFREVFTDRAYLLCELHRGVDDQTKLARLQHLARVANVPLVAAGDVHYHEAARTLLHDCLIAIRHGQTIDQIRHERLENSSYHLRSIDELKRIYRSDPAALARTLEVASRCPFKLDELRYEYPVELAPEGVAPSTISSD